jgi:hypothetical protein
MAVENIQKTDAEYLKIRVVKGPPSARRDGTVRPQPVIGRQRLGSGLMRQNRNPYDGFKSDRERRRALNVRVRWYSGAAMVAALAPARLELEEVLRWVMHWFH